MQMVAVFEMSLDKRHRKEYILLKTKQNKKNLICYLVLQI